MQRCQVGLTQRHEGSGAGRCDEVIICGNGWGGGEEVMSDMLGLWCVMHGIEHTHERAPHSPVVCCLLDCMVNTCSTRIHAASYLLQPSAKKITRPAPTCSAPIATLP